MKVVVAAIGRMKQGPERTLFDAYIARIPWSVDVREIGQKDNNANTEKLIAAVPKGAKVVCLKSSGQALTSDAFAQRLAAWRDDGYNHFAFLIGGPDGLPQSVLDQADLTLSFGLTTWPHMLVRVMLAEQLYRAHSILCGHPYHCGH